MKNLIKTVVSAVVAVSLVACSTQKEERTVAQTETDKIVLGSIGSDAQIWKYIAQSKEAKQLGLDIEVKEINDGVALNQAVIDKEVDVNAFQSWAYFKAFNKLKGEPLEAIATTYLEPMGLYSKRYKSLDDLPQKAVVAIPNDVANTSRALKLLEQAKVIQLKANFNPISGGLNDIEKNPKQISIKLVKGAQGPRVLDDVDVVAIGNTNALESGLNVIQDSLSHETVENKVVENINILVVRKDRKDDKNLQKLNTLYHQPFVEEYIKKHFGGTKLDINQPVSTLN